MLAKLNGHAPKSRRSNLARFSKITFSTATHNNSARSRSLLFLLALNKGSPFNNDRYDQIPYKTTSVALMISASGYEPLLALSFK